MATTPSFSLTANFTKLQTLSKKATLPLPAPRLAVIYPFPLILEAVPLTGNGANPRLKIVPIETPRSLYIYSLPHLKSPSDGLFFLAKSPGATRQRFA
jgi:hypothetical protein